MPVTYKQCLSCDSIVDTMQMHHKLITANCVKSIYDIELKSNSINIQKFVLL